MQYKIRKFTLKHLIYDLIQFTHHPSDLKSSVCISVPFMACLNMVKSWGISWKAHAHHLISCFTSSHSSWPWSIDSAGHLACRSPWETPRWADLLPFCGWIIAVQWDLVWKLICNWEYWGSLAPCHVPDCPFLLTHKTFFPSLL